MSKDFTPQELKFAEVFLEESRASNDYRSAFKKAKDAAEYPESATRATILAKVKDLIIEGINIELAQMTPKLLNSLEGIIDNPSLPGAKNTIAVAMTLLDRAGIVKVEKSEVKVDAPNGVLILPTKNELID